ncbi:Golgin subfamily A member 7/ERF4 family-domain-containing protein [Xylaria telfairii]|nr:Golgin subfamily A member 7/ERF4 family-domain-containing protein [Xylaria telfairii]
MHVLERPIPACMNSANLLLNPLNAIIAGRSRYSPSPRNRRSHTHDHDHDHAHDATGPQRPPRTAKSTAPSVTRHRDRVLDGSIANSVVAAALHFASPALGDRPDRRDRRDKGKKPDKANVVVSVSQQPEYPDNLNLNDNSAPEATADRPTRSRRRRAQQNAQGSGFAHSNRLLPPPFRSRAAGAGAENRLPRSTGTPGRLWNPTNSTPRLPPAVITRPARTPRKRRPSTPPPPAIPLNHPSLDATRIPDDQGATSAGDYPLLTLPEQRQSRRLTPSPTPTRSSFQIEERLNEGKRVSLPSSVRHSYDIKRALDAPSGVGPGSGLTKLKSIESSFADTHRKRGQGVARPRVVSFGLVHAEDAEPPALKIDKGKGKAVMSSPDDAHPPRVLSTDLERGPAVLDQQHNRSTLSIPSGIGSAITSSNSSIIGDPNQPGLGDEWGPQHPCFPHLNPYVPLNSTEYQTTRIIRVRRDWLIAADLAPTFSNMYPEILDPAGISEQEFRRVIEKLNGSLIPIFSPYSWRNILDGVLGVLTAWLWDDFGFTNVKTKLNELERWIDNWNAEMEKTTGSEEGAIAPKIISLRRTGYMTLDFQIPNPEVSISNSEPASRSGPYEPEPEPFASTAA